MATDRFFAGLFWVYSLLSHRAMEYYWGSSGLNGCGLSKHWPGDPGDPAQMGVQLWPWLPVVTGYFYGMRYMTDKWGDLLVLITDKWP